MPNERRTSTTPLQDWLAYLETCHRKSIDLGLDRITQVAKRLDVLTFACPVITVAGTNGKGSTSHMLASILQEAGYTVGLYTSPHLRDYRERIKINGIKISEESPNTTSRAGCARSSLMSCFYSD